MELSTSDIIQLLSIVISLFTSIIAIIISLISIRQNTKSLEESVKPCIAIYVDQITICEQKSYFVIKNFGSSPGIITEFIFLNPPETIHQILQSNFDKLQDIVLAPGQSKLICFECNNFNENTVYTFKISYKNGRKCYTDKYAINIRNFTQIPTFRPETKSQYAIRHSLREMIERMI